MVGLVLSSVWATFGQSALFVVVFVEAIAFILPVIGSASAYSVGFTEAARRLVADSARDAIARQETESGWTLSEKTLAGVVQLLKTNASDQPDAARSWRFYAALATGEDEPKQGEQPNEHSALLAELRPAAEAAQRSELAAVEAALATGSLDGGLKQGLAAVRRGRRRLLVAGLRTLGPRAYQRFGRLGAGFGSQVAILCFGAALISALTSW